MSKSFTSTAVGFAVQEKRLTLEDPVISFFPDKLPLQISGHLAAMRVRDLLTMQSGHKSDPIGKMFEAKDLVRGFLGSEIEFKPGTHFVYNNGATYMLSAIITKVTGESLRDYLTPRLFEPLGIENVKWEADDRGVNFGAWGLHLTPEDAAKFAQFCLNKGRWNGKQLLSEGWINLATAPQCNVVAGDDRSDWNQGYGFQFWRCRHNAFRGDGAFGQYAIAMPDQEMALAVTSGLRNMQSILDRVWEILLPAAEEKPAAPAPADAAALAEAVTHWEMPVLGSAGRILPFRRYALSENALQFETIEFASFDDHIELTLDGETMKAGFGRRIANTLSWREPVPRRMEASARWNSERELELLVSCCETPFQWSFLLTVEDSGVGLVRKSNLLFRTGEWPPLAGHPLD